jgi:hypothetical protein
MMTDQETQTVIATLNGQMSGESSVHDKDGGRSPAHTLVPGRGAIQGVRRSDEVRGLPRLSEQEVVHMLYSDSCGLLSFSRVTLRPMSL